MKIAFGTTALNKTKYLNALDGIGEYTCQLKNNLNQIDNVELLPISFFKKGEIDPLSSKFIGNFRIQALRASISGKPFELEQFLKNEKIKLFHATDHFIPKLSAVPTVSTVHDVIPWEFPHWYTFRQKLNHFFLRRSIFWSDHIITVSQYSKNRIVDVLNIPENKISVVHNSFDPLWSAPKSKKRNQFILDKYKISEPFIVFVGTIQKRKNLGLLCEALNKWCKINRRRNLKLVVIGQKSKLSPNELKFSLNFDEEARVHWLGHLDKTELISIVQSAEALVFPSLAEGFGIPILEGFAAGVPVIASNGTSIPEVAGDAAFLFDPTSVDDLVRAFNTILFNKNFCRILIQRGRERAKQFSWENNGLKTKNIYEQVIEKFEERLKVR